MLRFGEFVLNERDRLLTRDGVEVPVEPKVFDGLRLLAGRPGRLTTIAQLREALWPGITVGADALRRVVCSARRALGDSGRQQRWIRTRPGHGYVFRAEVEALAPAEDAWPTHGRPLVLILRELPRDLPRALE